jgi:CDP-glucose 4,6-dehydratase
MASLSAAYSGKRVFVTGHTGFKGSWLCAWLLDLGAEVTGYSLTSSTKPALFDQLGLAPRLDHHIGDVTDARALKKAVQAARPHFLFHLAAQPLVRGAHDNPHGTWDTNVMGTVNVLESLRQVRNLCAAVIVTSDKVYGSRPAAHVEGDPLNGSEPYGASKAAAELAVEAWRASFFSQGRKHPDLPQVAVATARSGNVIGGGDWAADRLVPDVMRALLKGNSAVIRNPASIRPWQHVLDPLAGYLQLGFRLRSALARGPASRLRELSAPFNFGPGPGDHRSVRELTHEILSHWPGKWTVAPAARRIVETGALRLASGKARRQLGWRPKWRFEAAVAKTVEWYRAVGSGSDPLRLTMSQLREHQE